MSDLENHPSPEKAAEAKAFHEKIAKQKKAASEASKSKVTYYAKGKKVIKQTVMPNGNKHTVYIGTTEECDKQKINYVK